MSYSASPAPQAKVAPSRVAASQPKVQSSTKAGSSHGSRESLGRVEELTTQVRMMLTVGDIMSSGSTLLLVG